jgi:hypothetical protein
VFPVRYELGVMFQKTAFFLVTAVKISKHASHSHSRIVHHIAINLIGFIFPDFCSLQVFAFA